MGEWRAVGVAFPGDRFIAVRAMAREMPWRGAVQRLSVTFPGGEVVVSVRWVQLPPLLLMVGGPSDQGRRDRGGERERAVRARLAAAFA